MYKRICLLFLFSILCFSAYAAELKTYKLNEDIIIAKNDKKYRIKFLSIKETKNRNQFSETRADRVVLIEYEYENISLDKDLSIIDLLSFKLYDKDNELLDSYPAAEAKDGRSVSPGRKSRAISAFALNNVNNYIELEYYEYELTFSRMPVLKVIFEW